MGNGPESAGKCCLSVDSLKSLAAHPPLFVFCLFALEDRRPKPERKWLDNGFRMGLFPNNKLLLCHKSETTEISLHGYVMSSRAQPNP